MNQKVDIVFGPLGFLSSMAGYEITTNESLETIFLTLSIVSLLITALPRIITMIVKLHSKIKKSLADNKLTEDEVKEITEMFNESVQVIQDVEQNIRKEINK